MTYHLRKRIRLDSALLQQENDSDDEFEQLLDVLVPEEHTDDETEVSDHNTDSEEEISDEEDEEDETSKETTFYMGKDKTTKWNVKPTDFQSRRMNLANVRKSTPNKRPGGLQTGLEWFELFFDNVVIYKIVEDTNSFIRSFTTEETMKSTYRLTDDIEIKGLIGLLILIGTMKSGTIKQLWQDEMGIGCDLCICALSSKRFEFLLRVLHFDDHQTRQERKSKDKFCHIREVFKRIVNNFQKYYTPTDCLTIDEQLLSFRGRCGFKQYIPSKPAKYGIKTWALVDPETFYTYNLETYVGTQNSTRFQKSNKPEDVVLRLVEPIKKSGRNITADNWFTSIPLIEKLTKLKFSYVGTIRKNKRELPNEFKSNRKREVLSSLFGFYQITSNLDIALVSYVPKKNKAVVLVSTLHNNAEIDETSKEKKKPSIITFYNQDKAGVDVVDQLCANYNCRLRTNEQPMIVFLNLINLSGINAFILHSEDNNFAKKSLRYKFLQNLAFGLIKPLIQKRMGFKQIPVGIRQKCARLCQKDLPSDPSSSSFQSLNRDNCLSKAAESCFLCKSSLNIFKNARNSCSKCNKRVFPKHMYKICDSCIPE